MLFCRKMALRDEPPPGDPYTWDASVEVPPAEQQLWAEVATGLEKNQTVVWTKAVESLGAASRFFEVAPEARKFVETYMKTMIGILLEQYPSKIGQHERGCVEESIKSAISIIAVDLNVQLQRNGDSSLLDVLEIIFSKKKAYYKGSKANWNVNHLSGLPEVRITMIDLFSQQKGFELLAKYMARRIGTDQQFLPLEMVHSVLAAILDALCSRTLLANRGPSAKGIEDDAVLVGKSVVDFISASMEVSLKSLPLEILNSIRQLLQRIYDRLVGTHRAQTIQFYAFWQALTLKLITSQSLPLKLFGWDQLTDLIEAASAHRPPPKSFSVAGAGCGFVNGEYDFGGVTTDDGYALKGSDISYVREIPQTEEGGGKRLTLFRCTMRSQQKWWFLSEADEEQPGTDRDIDYYQHKSMKHEERAPPPHGWITCRNAGVDPPPRFQANGVMVPPGEEYNTLEHHLAKWAIENGIIEDVLGNSVHREIVARSTPLIKFLAFMCDDGEVTEVTGTSIRNVNCLQTSHLLLAWKICTSKADAAVSNEVYQLLVTILPCLPSALAITLLKAIQTSLHDRNEKRDYLVEVAEFCEALSTSAALDTKGGNATREMSVLSDNVRAEVLKLLWAVLTHPDASSLKTYDNLKRYVTNELRVEPMGTIHRENFLETCRQALEASSKKQSGVSSADEVLALRMVGLTRFVLEACPPEQAAKLVTANNGGLAMLLFNEVTAYIARRNFDLSLSPNQKKSGNGDAKFDGLLGLSERFRILRYAYGLSEQISLSFEQLQHLWQLCSIPSDREELMIFIASAATPRASTTLPASSAVEPPVLQSQPNQVVPVQQPLEKRTTALADGVGTAALRRLFCSPSVDWGELGAGAYQSFQKLHHARNQGLDRSTGEEAVPLEALWRICLEAGSEDVAAQARKDLLMLYANVAKPKENHNDRPASPEDPNFGDRVFDCLVDVKKGLERGNGKAERAAERLLRILNAAIGQDGSGTRSITSSYLSSLSSMSPEDSVQKAQSLLPHGMRAQSCYRRIGIMAKRTNIQHQPGQGPVQQTPSGREDVPGAATQPRQTSTLRFSIDVHPLETLLSVKDKVARHCNCSITAVRPISVSGRLAGTATRSSGGDSSQTSLNVVPDDSVMDQLGVVGGCEMVFVLADRQLPTTNAQPAFKNTAKPKPPSVSEFFTDGESDSAIRLFNTLLDVLALLPWPSSDKMMNGRASSQLDTHKLVWDLLFAMPSNGAIVDTVRSTADLGLNPERRTGSEDEMELESSQEKWTDLLDKRSFHRSVYIMQVIDSFLQPAPEVFSAISLERKRELAGMMELDSITFRKAFISSGGFDAVARFFATPEGRKAHQQSESRMGNAVALRILKCCLFGSDLKKETPELSSRTPDEEGSQLLQTLPDAGGLLRSLTAMVVGDEGISTSTISDVLKFLRLLFRSSHTTEIFVALPHNLAEKFLVTLLLWDGGHEISRTSSGVGSAAKIRMSMHELVLSIPILCKHALPWLINAMDDVEVTSDATKEYFDVLGKIVSLSAEKESKTSTSVSREDLHRLGNAVCKKLASCPRPTSDNAMIDFSTGVLCACLRLLRAIIETGGGGALRTGTSILLKELKVDRWSELNRASTKGVLAMVSSSFRSSDISSEDATLIDLTGAIFDGFLSPGGSSSAVSICCDKESRQLGFSAIAAAARSCHGHEGYAAVVSKISGIISSAAPYLRHRWNHQGGSEDGHSRSMRNASKYSGLRNQGCTCYMNSVLQQLFMMPELREAMCAAPLPASLRTSGGSFARGAELVGKKISLQWDSGVSYDADVKGFDEETRMHTIVYCQMQVAQVSGSGHQQVRPTDLQRVPLDLPDEFILSEGRPGKETGVFEVVETTMEEETGENADDEVESKGRGNDNIEETEDEGSSRHLVEEIQRTFIHLDEGSRGRCFDPRALVEACNCLKLEFDVWQQNDASEFAMKLLDRMEISLKKWAPDHFKYLEHTFGLKQTKLKICKECGLKTTREENLMNIDCQIRGKTDIHDALSTMCEVELMEGSNQVLCDRCKKNTDTVLKTAISALPNMLILSLKRFDLDYNTFETVKLNSRCEFGQTLNMKRYTLEGVEAMEGAGMEEEDPSAMDTTDDGNDGNSVDPLSSLPDEDYEYKLAGVLVHAGVAQGGHYYSFIKERPPGGSTDADKWYRFDDEDVTPFDPASIEVECFGGKVKKETKWPNGHVQTVESEQFANALMLFYEKVKPTDTPDQDENSKQKDMATDLKIKQTSGYDVFEPDVRRANATHRWETFLFDAEFHAFLKGLLGFCRNSKARGGDSMDVSISPVPDDTWQQSMLQMLLSFVFDVLLYSAEKGSVDDWSLMLSDILLLDRECAKVFVEELTARSKKVSANWLRTYLSDCPDRESRLAAVRIFGAAIRSCSSIDAEQQKLRLWSDAWRNQVVKYMPLLNAQVSLPMQLEDRIDLEDVAAVRNGQASAVGIILSYLTVLLSAAPRTWRYSPELYLLIRDLARDTSGMENVVLRSALNEVQIPARMVSLVLRERAPGRLRVAFPGETASVDVIETQIRAETTPTSHLMPLSNNPVMGTADLSPRGAAGGAPTAMDYATIFEALGCLIGMPGAIPAQIVAQKDDPTRGRPHVFLTDVAKAALTQVFRDACSQPELGMGQREIEAYLQQCGVDSSSLPTQKITDILRKYPTTTAGDSGKSPGLSLEGFLAYYEDTAQTNEMRVRADLHTFGYRPDFSRRSSMSRFSNVDDPERKRFRKNAESVAIDMAMKLKNQVPDFGPLLSPGLDTYQFFAWAYNANETLAEHLLAYCACGRSTKNLLEGTLKALCRAPPGWGGNETWSASTTILNVLASVPDSGQEERISTMMQSTETPGSQADHGIGLIVVAKAYSRAQARDQRFSSEYHYTYTRYLNLIRELFQLPHVANWMGQHQTLWNWMERDLRANSEPARGHQPVRTDYSRREAENPAMSFDGQQHSHIHAPIPDSEDEDEDSGFDYNTDPLYKGERILVDQAGLQELNGVYEQAGNFEQAGRYEFKNTWNGKETTFTLFRCNVSNNTKHWFISIVPKDVQPGTNKDVDFYSAPVTEDDQGLPPKEGWTKAAEGLLPPPSVHIVRDDGQMWQDTEEPSEQGQRSNHVSYNM